MKEYNYTNRFNDTLYGHSWEVENPSKVVLLVTGMAEHSARYDHFASFLNENNISVYCLDHYGQGEKNGEKMNPPEDYFFKMIDTLKDVAKMLKSLHNVPLILIAHSMGSFVSQGFIEKYSREIDKVILIGTNGKNPLVKIGNLLAKISIHKNNENKKAKFFDNLSIGAYVKSVKDRKDDNEWLSFNEENYKKYGEDELCGITPTNKFYKEFLKGLASIQKGKNIASISKDLPILILGGDSDPVGNNGKGLKNLSSLYKSYGLNAEVKVYEHMRHEILNETKKEEVYQDILTFINK